MGSLRLVLLLFLLCAICVGAFGQEKRAENPAIAEDKHKIWKEISAFFAPPDAFKGVMGTYRSPLTFYNGQPVRTKDDWKKRREEILQRWHALMGPWPSLLKDQQMIILDSVQRDGFMQYSVSFFWMTDEITKGYLLIPRDGSLKKKPAVVTVYYEPETAIGEGRPHRDFAYQLARRGFVTLSIGTTEASLSKTYSLYYPDIEHAQVQPLSMLAYAAANAWHVLANSPQVDSARIGIMGHSFGGKWAMFASCLFEKFACAVWSDPGIVFDGSRANINYWAPWYLGYHPPPWRKRGLITKENPAHGLYPRLIEQGYDLHELHALMAPRPFLVSGGEEDGAKQWIPLNHTLAVNTLLGLENRVAMTNRPDHAPNQKSNEQAFLFLEYFLK